MSREDLVSLNVQTALGDHFCHQEDIQKDGFRKLVEGQQVTYDLGSDNKGNIKAVAVSAGAMPKRPRRKRKPRSD